MARTKNSVIDDRTDRKKFEDIRVFVRDMFINGFRGREGLDALLGDRRRSADKTRQIINSILADYYKVSKEHGTRYLIAIDTRLRRHNPLHYVWKARTFTGADIIMHFHILDRLRSLSGQGGAVSKKEIHEEVAALLWEDFDNSPYLYSNAAGMKVEGKKHLSLDKVDEKLSDMTELGVITQSRSGKFNAYKLADSFDVPHDMLDFASEVMPVSTIGSYLLDRQEYLDFRDENHDAPSAADSFFTFKHNMISQVLDDGVMFLLLEAVRQHRPVRIFVYDRKLKEELSLKVIPLRIIRNAQNGRQYLGCMEAGPDNPADSIPDAGDYRNIRLDHIRIEQSTENRGRYMYEAVENFDDIRAGYDAVMQHVWGVSLVGTAGSPKHVSFTIKVRAGQEYAAARLRRECRQGKVEDIGEGRYRFSIDLYDSGEILPWISTFYGRIVDLEFEDTRAMHRLQSNFLHMEEHHPCAESSGGEQK